MHELSFAVEILDRVEREAAKYAGSRVTRVRLRAGRMLNIEPSSLAFCLEAISSETPLAGAEIDFRQDDGMGTDLIIEEIELDAPDCED